MSNDTIAHNDLPHGTGEWHPVEPEILVLTVECERHDLAAVRDALGLTREALRDLLGGNVGPITIN